MNDKIDKVFIACSANGYVPVGTTVRAKLTDACAYVMANSTSTGEDDLWSDAKDSASFLEDWFAKHDAMLI